MNRFLSKAKFDQAQKFIPGGVNSPVRSFRSVDDTPVFIKKGYGSKLLDIDGNEYIDYVLSWGAAILGHAEPNVVEAVSETLRNGFSFGATTEGETLLVEKILSAFPKMEAARLVSSGTEACMTAIRLARGFTGRDKLIKFSGNYHGHSDSLLVAAGSGLATYSIPTSAGVPAKSIENTLVAPFNDLSYVKELFRSNKGEIAAIILEPFVGNAGFIRPKEGYLQGLREICSNEGALLIIDEVMTGFRVAWGGAQILLNVEADITTLGKVIGGGLPLAALGGKREIMRYLAPLGPVYQAGTLSGNPLAVACGLKTLEILGNTGNYDRISKITRKLMSGILELAAEHKINVQVDSEGGMFGLFFSDRPVESYEEAQQSDTGLFKKFFKGVFERGIYWAPSMYEAGFLSLAHTEEDIHKTLDVIHDVFREVRR